MMENRPKLHINRNILLGEKSPPPTKLLITHGKPNFTIVKSPKTVCPPPCEVNIFCGEELKPSALRKKSPPKISSNHTNGTVDSSTSSDEFLQLHKKIGGRNFDEIENNNNVNVALVKESPPADQHFATIQRNFILTLKSPSETNGHHAVENNNNEITENGIKSPAFKKSSSPEKPESLKYLNSSRTTRSPSPLSKQNSSFNQSTESVTSPPAIHFEQRTVVSFSRDLSVTPNRYPDTVKTTKTTEFNGEIKSLPKEFSALKFEIAPDGELVRSVKKNAA